MANTKKSSTAKKSQGVKKQNLKKKTSTTQITIPIVPSSSNATMTKEKFSLSNLIHEPSWTKHLQAIFQSKNFEKIEEFLNNEWSQGKVTYPPNHLIFEAFNQTPFDKVKIVLLGQDPYHDDGQVELYQQFFYFDSEIKKILLGTWISFFSTENNQNSATIVEKYLQRTSK